MDQLSNFISEYLKTCETIKKLNSKTIKAYRIDLSQFHTLWIWIMFVAFYFIKKSEILNLKTNKIKYILVALLFLSFIYTSCIEIIFYNQIFNYHMIIILISINLLTLFLCYIFLETQKEQKLLLKLQRDQLKRENESKINLINQKNVTHLNSWKHDITYIFSYLKTY